MPYRDISSKVSKYLYDEDPMNTCCKENEAYDEYDSIAVIIADEHSNNNEDYWGSLFDEMFGDIPGEDVLTRIVEIIEEVIQ